MLLHSIHKCRDKLKFSVWFTVAQRSSWKGKSIASVTEIATIIMALSSLLYFNAWRYKGQCKRFSVMKGTYKNGKTLFSGNLKFKKVNSYSHSIRLQRAVWQAGQIWRLLTELAQGISLIVMNRFCHLQLGAEHGLGLQRTYTLP